MANIETPNYLTSIEYYLFKDNLDDYRSLNFSEEAQLYQIIYLI